MDSPDYLARTHQCPDCLGRSRLVVRWNGKADECWCPVCKRTDGFIRRASLMAQWKADPDSVSIEIANIFERKLGMKPLTGTELAVVTEQSMMERIESARWLKAVSPEDRLALASLSVQYGFDPLMRELIIYEGQPYITVQGLIRMAHRQKMFAGVEDRPMTDDERKQYGYKAEVCWIAKVYRKDWKVPAIGTGKADGGKPFRNNMIEKDHPEWMARSRALRQALKLAFPHHLPFEAMESAEERGIDPETGEILDSPAVEWAEVADPVQDAADVEMAQDFIQEEEPDAQLIDEILNTVTAKGYSAAAFRTKLELEQGTTMELMAEDVLKTALRRAREVQAKAG